MATFLSSLPVAAPGPKRGRGAAGGGGGGDGGGKLHGRAIKKLLAQMRNVLSAVEETYIFPKGNDFAVCWASMQAAIAAQKAGEEGGREGIWEASMGSASVAPVPHALPQAGRED